jgi:hypothetical protein
MVDIEPEGRPIPVLLYMLWGSFILMILSGIFYGLGLPEQLARALFIATVAVWTFLGLALMYTGYQERVAYEQDGEGGSDGEI